MCHPNLGPNFSEYTAHRAVSANTLFLIKNINIIYELTSDYHDNFYDQANIHP